MKMLDKFPFYEECEDALNIMKNSPGLDGFPGEFYQTFWSNEIGFIFYEALKDIYYQREMSSSQKS